MRAALGLFLLLLVPVAQRDSVEACRCSDDPLEIQAEFADAVFVGRPVTLVETAETPAGVQELWTFDVAESLIGPAGRRINVGGGGTLSNCSVDFAGVGTVGILANWQSGHLVAGQCGVVDAEALLAALRPRNGGTPPWMWFALTAAAVVASIYVLTVARRNDG